jgi:hypothetical protein
MTQSPMAGFQSVIIRRPPTRRTTKSAARAETRQPDHIRHRSAQSADARGIRGRGGMRSCHKFSSFPKPPHDFAPQRRPSNIRTSDRRRIRSVVIPSPRLRILRVVFVRNDGDAREKAAFGVALLGHTIPLICARCAVPSENPRIQSADSKPNGVKWQSAIVQPDRYSW